MTALVKYEAMCHAIDAVFEVDEAKDIRDKAAAMEAYFKQAKNMPRWANTSPRSRSPSR